MPAYKYKTSKGKVMWMASFYFTDWTGKRKKKLKRGFSTKKEAQLYEASELRKGEGDCDILFGELFEKYFEDMSNRLKPTTMSNKRYMMEDKILPFFQDLPINEIDSLKVRQWQNYWMNFKQKNGQHYKPTYLKTLNNQLSAIMNYAVLYYHLPYNPCHAAGSMGKSSADEMHIWTADEFTRFLEHEPKQSFHIAFETLFYTGMREGELLALTPADIDRKLVIHVNKNFKNLKSEELVLTPKTDRSNRDIPIPQFLYDDLQKYIKTLYGIQPHDRIFYYTHRALQHEIHRCADRAGLPWIRVHDLRHSHAAMLIHYKVPIVQLSRRLGHKSIKTTIDTYGHLYPDDSSEIADLLQNLQRPDENSEI